jgi:hypothetical protein
MNTPVFPPLSSPTPALDWHARARMYRQQATELVDIVDGQPNWPRYFLLAHAAELAIRSVFQFAKSAGVSAGQEPGKHDLSALYDHACKLGLQSNPQILEPLAYLSEIHDNHVARYPRTATQIWFASEFDDAVDHLLTATWQHIRSF